MVSFVLRTMSLAKNCPYSLTCFTDFCHRLERAGTMLPCFNMKRWKISSGLILTQCLCFCLLLSLYISPPSSLFFLQKRKKTSMIFSQTTPTADTLEVLVGFHVYLCLFLSAFCVFFYHLFLPSASLITFYAILTKRKNPPLILVLSLSLPPTSGCTASSTGGV